MPRSCLDSVLTAPVGVGGVTPLSCLGSTLGCIRSAGIGVVDLDWPGVVYVLACIHERKNQGNTQYVICNTVTIKIGISGLHWIIFKSQHYMYGVFWSRLCTKTAHGQVSYHVSVRITYFMKHTNHI